MFEYLIACLFINYERVWNEISKPNHGLWVHYPFFLSAMKDIADKNGFDFDILSIECACGIVRNKLVQRENHKDIGLRFKRMRERGFDLPEPLEWDCF